MLRQHLKASTFLAFAFSLLLLFGGLVALCPAAMISYGNFGPVPPGITFLDVMESSGTDPVPLFGPPTPFSVGLDFSPTSFVSTSNGGSLDVTDGQLNFTVMGSNAFPINGISLFEAGDYTLFGTGTAATQALAGAIIRATVTQINGVNVSPFDLITSNAFVGFNLLANPGIVQPWSLGTALDVAGQLGDNQRATKVKVSINNQLLTASEAASLAFIAKKDFRINIGTNRGPEVPEPSTLPLVLSGCVAIGSLAWRKGLKPLDQLKRQLRRDSISTGALGA